MADAMEAVRHGVQQEPTDELVRGEGHHLGLAVVTVVFPGQTDLAVGEPGQPVVGDGDPVRLAAEIGEHLRRAGERTLGVDHPLDAAEGAEAFGESIGSGEGCERARKAQLARCERRP